MIALATVVFLPFLALGRWLVRNGQTRTGIGCVGSILLTLVPFLAIYVVFPSEEHHMTYAELALFALSACGLVGLFVCFCALVPFMAEREERLSRSQGHIGNEQGDKSPQDQPIGEPDTLP